jgi:hypothetical protein
VSDRPKTIRCAIYTRKSTEHNLDLEFNSLHAQREACEAYIKSQMHEGWQLIPDAYDDGGISGASLDRPDLQRLLGDIAAGKVDNIVVYKVDRLTRSLIDFAKLVELFDEHGVSFVSVTQAFNTTTSMWTQSAANHAPLEFLVYQGNNREFSTFRGAERSFQPETPAISVLWRQIPYNSKQGIISRYQGRKDEEQGSSNRAGVIGRNAPHRALFGGGACPRQQFPAAQSVVQSPAHHPIELRHLLQPLAGLFRSSNVTAPVQLVGQSVEQAVLLPNHGLIVVRHCVERPLGSPFAMPAGERIAFQQPGSHASRAFADTKAFGNLVETRRLGAQQQIAEQARGHRR